MREARIKPLGFGGRILLLPFLYLLWNLKTKTSPDERRKHFCIHKPLGIVARLWLCKLYRMRSAKSKFARLLPLFYNPPPRSKNFLSLPIRRFMECAA